MHFLFDLWFAFNCGLHYVIQHLEPLRTEIQIFGSCVAIRTDFHCGYWKTQRNKKIHIGRHTLPQFEYQNAIERKRSKSGNFYHFTTTFTSCPEQQIQWVHDRKENYKKWKSKTIFLHNKLLKILIKRIWDYNTTEWGVLFYKWKCKKWTKLTLHQTLISYLVVDLCQFISEFPEEEAQVKFSHHDSNDWQRKGLHCCSNFFFFLKTHNTPWPRGELKALLLSSQSDIHVSQRS